MNSINTKFEKVLTIKTKKMKNQKLKLTDLRKNQLTKAESLKVFGGGRGTKITCMVDEDGNSFNALTGEPLSIKNCGHGGGVPTDGVYEIYI